MLGDVSIRTRNNRKSYLLQFEWSDKYKEYIDHIHNLFDEWILSPPHRKVRINCNNNMVITWGFQTFSHNAFNPLGDLFLQSGKKGIAENLIKNFLTARGLAYWFMDDGGKLDYNVNSKNKSVVLNTHSFTDIEVITMCNELAKKFNLDCDTRNNKGRKIIVINHSSYSQFIKLIDPFLISQMRKKLPK